MALQSDYFSMFVFLLRLSIDVVTEFYTFNKDLKNVNMYNILDTTMCIHKTVIFFPNDI